jgi:hypothetical protein
MRIISDLDHLGRALELLDEADRLIDMIRGGAPGFEDYGTGWIQSLLMSARLHHDMMCEIRGGS